MEKKFDKFRENSLRKLLFIKNHVFLIESLSFCCTYKIHKSRTASENFWFKGSYASIIIGTDGRSVMLGRNRDLNCLFLLQILRPPVHLSETEEIENLISQMKDRVNLEDDDENLIEELESRLKRLKAETALLGISSSGTASPRLPSPQSQDQPNKRVPKPRKKRELLFSSMEVDDDDSDEEAEKVARSLTELMPEKDTVPGEDDSEKFCIICPDEPVLQCLDCDGDLYCGRCFRESHKEWDLKGHRTKKVC